jgi:hypothetical protein
MLAPKSFRRIPLYRFMGLKSKAKRPALPIAVTEQALWFAYRKNTPTNILFGYLYRDASNYKLHGEVIFSNHSFLPLADIEQQIRACLNDGEFFIARQVNIEERFFDALQDDDHPWHEFERVELTTLAPFDPENWTQKQCKRDISEFLAELEQAHRAGWDELNVRADMAQLQEQQKTELTQRFRAKINNFNAHCKALGQREKQRDLRARRAR